MKDHQANWRPTDRLPTHVFQRHYLHLLNLLWMYMVDVLRVVWLWFVGDVGPRASSVVLQDYGMLQCLLFWMIHLSNPIHLNYILTDWTFDVLVSTQRSIISVVAFLRRLWFALFWCWFGWLWFFLIKYASNTIACVLCVSFYRKYVANSNQFAN